MTDTTEVKRFEPYTDEGNREGYGQMEMCENGDWVRATDYDALAAKLAAAERRERQLLDTTVTCRMLLRELNTAKAKLAEVEASSQGWIDAAVEQQVRRKRAEARLLEVEAERDGWIETARIHHDAEAAFLKWLRAAGEHMRAEGVTVCDDGSDSGGILAAKVPACAALLQARAEAAEAKLAEADAMIEAQQKDYASNNVRFAEAEYRAKAAEAALPAVYRLGLDEGANVAASGTSRNDTYSKGRNDAATAIRALPTPTAAELMARIHTGEKE